MLPVVLTIRPALFVTLAGLKMALTLLEFWIVDVAVLTVTDCRWRSRCRSSRR